MTNEWDFLEDEVQEDEGVLDREAVDAIRSGASSLSDVEAAERLLDQVSALMVSVATGGPKIDNVNRDYQREYKALAAVLKRLGIKNPNRYSDLWRWHGKWSDGSLPTWASRRAFVADLYGWLREELDEKATGHHELAVAADDGPTGWPDVDAKLGKLRRRVREAEDVDDFKVVGLQCIAVLEALGRACFVSQRHLPAREEEPHRNDAKNRIKYFVDAAAEGDRFEHVKTLGRAAWRQAQSIKHREKPNRTDAGIAADSVVLVVAIVRRLADEENYYYEMADAHFADEDEGF